MHCDNVRNTDILLRFAFHVQESVIKSLIGLEMWVMLHNASAIFFRHK